MDNLTLLTDFYQLTMAQGYHGAGMLGKRAVFDLFFRDNPCGGGYTIAAGLAQAMDYIENLRFTEEDVAYLRSQNCFAEDFLDYLKTFRFTGDIDAVPEGTPVFPREPILRVTAPVAEAQFVETALLNIINHQSLIATKASRVCHAAGNDTVLEFGLRRAQGPTAGVYGARAAVIGGCVGTSNVLAGRLFGVPVRGTIAHSWVMQFGDELDAFRAYAKQFPNACVLLVDTYDTLKSGIPNAIKVFREMREQGLPETSFGVRLDSGDIAYLSKAARHMLDDAGFPNVIISASGDLDEHIIASLKQQGARVTMWGVGTRLITSRDSPALGGVYKLAAESDGGEDFRPVIKLSENADKVTNPGVKAVCRLYERKSGRVKADYITLAHERPDDTADLTLFDPHATWKRMTLHGGEYVAKELLAPVFRNGERVYDSPLAMAIRDFCRQELDTLWDEYRRLVNPHILPVDLSQELYDLKAEMIRKIRG